MREQHGREQVGTGYRVTQELKGMSRRWLWWLLFFLFIVVVITRFTEIEALAETVIQGQWQLVVTAFLLQFLYYTLFTVLYQVVFSIVGVKGTVRELFPVMFASLFVNLAPTGGAGGAALFVYEATQRNQSAARATAGTVLVQVADYGSFTPLLGLALLYLFSKHDLKPYEVIATILLILVLAGVSHPSLDGIVADDGVAPFS